jgi:hypothetical protein
VTRHEWGKIPECVYDKCAQFDIQSILGVIQFDEDISIAGNYIMFIVSKGILRNVCYWRGKDVNYIWQCCITVMSQKVYPT